MHKFDFAVPAELYVVNGGQGRRKEMTFRRFASAAMAIRHVVEELSPARQKGSVIEASEQRHHYREICALYERDDYPLARAAGKVNHGDETELPVRTIGAGQSKGAKEGGKAAGQG